MIELTQYIALSGLVYFLFYYVIGFYPMRLYTIPLGLVSLSPEGTEYEKDGSIPSDINIKSTKTSPEGTPFDKKVRSASDFDKVHTQRSPERAK